MTHQEKLHDLRRRIAARGSMLIAYSGGVDSTLLAVVAKEVLGNKTHCVLLDSPVVPRAAIVQAEILARELGLAFEIIAVPILENKEFCRNPAERCYHCKKISAAFLRQRADELGFASVADGINVSDMGEHRPGLRASTEEGIIHPFIEAGITKQDIRTIARGMDLPVWQKPSEACLASRIPYGDEITVKKLSMIEDAEAYLNRLGIRQLRVRLHGNVARIEVHIEDREKILDPRSAVAGKLRSMGFAYVTLDLEGYRSGSMDEVLE
jgi:pyridinium-3,5-biscarboxylic acid mononucleotide sulfurtransferase